MQVFSGSEDGNVYMWSLVEAEVLYTMKHPIDAPGKSRLFRFHSFHSREPEIHRNGQLGRWNSLLKNPRCPTSGRARSN